MVNAVGGYDTVVTVKTRCCWVKFIECGKILHSKKFPLKLKGAVYKNKGQQFCMAVKHGA